MGKVDDVFISKKVRKHTKDCFAFVRFRKSYEAMDAIKRLNGYSIRDRKLKVSVAKFNKGGSPINNNRPKASGMENKMILRPALRDDRTYYNVLMGEQPSTSVEKQNTKSIPIEFTLNVKENDENVMLLKFAVIAENTEVFDIAHKISEVAAAYASVKGMFLLSPTKLLLYFDCELEVEAAVSEDCVLWSMFDDIRKWSEGEIYDDRLVWLECYGINLKCWSRKNLRCIGEKWGPFISIEDSVENLRSLSFARILVRTKAQNKVESRIRLLFEHGSCDVWVKEGAAPRHKIDRICKDPSLVHCVDESCDLRINVLEEKGTNDRVHVLPSVAEAGDDRTMDWDDKVDENIEGDGSIDDITVDRGGFTVSAVVPEAGDDKRIECEDRIDDNSDTDDRGDFRVEDRPVCVVNKSECEYGRSNGEAGVLAAVNVAHVHRTMRFNDNVDDKIECVQCSDDRLEENDYFGVFHTLTEAEDGDDRLGAGDGNTENKFECKDKNDGSVHDRVECVDDKIEWVCNRSTEVTEEDRSKCDNTGVDSFDDNVNDRMIKFEYRNKFPAPDDETICLENPLLADIASRKCGVVLNDWFDPIAADEVGRSLVVTAQLTLHDLPGLSEYRGSHLRRPQGRPKKSNDRAACDADVDRTRRDGRSLEKWEGKADDSMSELGRSNKHLASDGESTCLETHLLAYIASRADGMNWYDRLDPIVAIETSEWLSIPVQQTQEVLPVVSDMAAGSKGSHLRRL